jgi:N6-adenosine-specific RNA methylase IME4
MDLDVGFLSDRGFIFLWCINSQLQAGFECLNKWGYTYVDRVRVSYSNIISETRDNRIRLANLTRFPLCLLIDYLDQEDQQC